MQTLVAAADYLQHLLLSANAHATAIAPSFLPQQHVHYAIVPFVFLKGSLYAKTPRRKTYSPPVFREIVGRTRLS
jgi:hypothetical protein